MARGVLSEECERVEVAGNSEDGVTQPCGRRRSEGGDEAVIHGGGGKEGIRSKGSGNVSGAADH